MSKPIKIPGKSRRARDYPKPEQIVLVKKNKFEVLNFNSGQPEIHTKGLPTSEKSWIGIKDLKDRSAFVIIGGHRALVAHVGYEAGSEENSIIAAKKLVKGIAKKVAKLNLWAADQKTHAYLVSCDEPEPAVKLTAVRDAVHIELEERLLETPELKVFDVSSHLYKLPTGSNSPSVPDNSKSDNSEPDHFEMDISKPADAKPADAKPTDAEPDDAKPDDAEEEESEEEESEEEESEEDDAEEDESEEAESEEDDSEPDNSEPDEYILVVNRDTKGDLRIYLDDIKIFHRTQSKNPTHGTRTEESSV